MASTPGTPRELLTPAAANGLGWGGIGAGILASSCCILPLALVSFGIGGAWVGKLTALAPFQPYFLAAAALMIGSGLWRAYRKQEVCLPDSICANPSATRSTKTLLWIGAFVAASALGVDILAPYFI